MDRTPAPQVITGTRTAPPGTLAYITLRAGGPFAFAGLWERWHGEEGDVQSCSIVTTAANELMRPLHDRMPVILDPKDYAAWLDQDTQAERGATRFSGGHTAFDLQKRLG
jgi:putative SOS response-associated peptidase YedK